MVRSVLALSMSVSLLVLAALWSMEDPQPWVPVAPEATEPTRSTTPEVGNLPSSDHGAPTPALPPEIPCLGAKGSPAEPSRTASGAVPTIQHHGSGLYELSRAEVERLLLEPSPELLSTRVLPEVKEGQVTGYRVQFAESSPLGGLGLRSGDVVQAVNGIALNSPAATLDAYQRLREGGGGELELLRGGRPVRVRYVLR